MHRLFALPRFQDEERTAAGRVYAAAWICLLAALLAGPLAASLQPERGAPYVLGAAAMGLASLVTIVVILHGSLRRAVRRERELESLGRMAGRIAHDFNNLLTIVIGYSDALATGLPPGDPMQDDLQTIRDAGERAARMVARLVTVSGKQPARPQTVDLNTLVTGSQRLLEGLLGANIDLAIALSSAPCWVVADPAQIREILTNLALNARQAMPGRGKLTIETSSDGGHMGGSVQLTVRDTGTGISEEVLPRLFEPFVTTRRATGAGLGLAEVYGIVTQNGGRIAASSCPGRGAAFAINLPRVPAPAASDAEAAKPAANNETALAGYAILIVDDEPAIRKSIRLALAPHGCAILEAGGGEEALAAAAVHEGKIDIAIVDFVLPGLNGFDLALQLERNSPALKTLYVSSAVDSIGMASVFRHAPDRVLPKPFTAAQVVERVLALAQRRA
jgi:signal transduction histidine kinase/ActR/RegA family two-component response regulator